jgi:dCMP deaminase
MSLWLGHLFTNISRFTKEQTPLAESISKRPDMDEYMMSIAVGVRARANCKGSHIGAVLAREGHIVSTGYNGTPHHTPNCDEGGCGRCSNRDDYPSGTGYDLCICVHAEQNALLSAARFGIAVDGSILYTTWRPCFGCTKEMLQAGVLGVRYGEDWEPKADLKDEYERLQGFFEEGVKKVDLPEGAEGHSPH